MGEGDGARRDRRPGELVDASTALTVLEPPRYVSRGGEKLAGALDAFAIDPHGWTCLDVGASTGGFTDCLLQRGARRVYALDVGRGQLADALRSDARVASMERTHAARLDPASDDPLTLPEHVRLAVVDASFISLTRLMAGIAAWVVPAGDIVALVKPQFELTPRQVPRGVVRDAAARAEAVTRVRSHATGLGLIPLAESDSVLPGPAGNRETFLHLRVGRERA
ncbi:TlyA family rRNA (cytidine-2'-O)-methyltransferase [soil metagenome]